MSSSTLGHYLSTYFAKIIAKSQFKLGPSINGLVTDGNIKLCCRGYILALFQSNTANKCGSEHTQDYKRLLPGMRS